MTSLTTIGDFWDRGFVTSLIDCPVEHENAVAITNATSSPSHGTHHQYSERWHRQLCLFGDVPMNLELRLLKSQERMSKGRRTDVVGSKGAFSMEFMLPLLFPDRPVSVVYFSGIATNHLEFQAVGEFLTAFLGADLADGRLRSRINAFYGLPNASWPLPVAKVLALLYRRAGCQANVLERRPNVDCMRALFRYSELLANSSRAKWDRQVPLSRSVITFSQEQSVDRLLAGLAFDGRQALFRVDGQEVTVHELSDRFDTVRFKGDTSIIKLLPYGNPTFVPWYVRHACKSCPGVCDIPVRSSFIPMYSRRFDRRNAFWITGVSNLPWGLVWDLFPDPTPRFTSDDCSTIADRIQALTPTRVEDRALRCCLHFTIGHRRRESAARDFLGGIEQKHVWGSSNTSDPFRTNMLLSADVADHIWFLLAVRQFRRLYFTGETTLIEGHVARVQDRLLQIANKSQLFPPERLKATFCNLTTAMAANRSDYEIRNLFGALKPLERAFRKSVVGELVSLWSDVERKYRLTLS